MGKIIFENKTDDELAIMVKQSTPGHQLHDGALREKNRRHRIASSEERALHEKELVIADSSKNAAWAAAVAAIISVVISIVALVVSIKAIKSA